jgi:hypothetical protein
MPLKLRSTLPHEVFQVPCFQGRLDSLSIQQRVLLVHFFALDCCQTDPHLQRVAQWAEEHAERNDFQVIGIHSPRTAAEHDQLRLAALLAPLQPSYPVLADESGQLQVAFANEQVPCVYLFDKQAQLRHVQAGEVGIPLTVQRLQHLLKE